MPPKRKSAYSAVLREAQQESSTVEQGNSGTAEQVSSFPVSPSSGVEAAQYYRETGVQGYSEAGILYPGEAVGVQSSETGIQGHGSTGIPQESATVVKKERKVTFYLTGEQEDKLTRLEFEYFLATGKRINRNDIVRYLVDLCDITMITRKPL